MTRTAAKKEGSLWHQIGAFCLPYLCSCFLQTLYGMADLFIIGQFEGAGSITAVSIGSQVMHMVTVMIVGLAMGTTVHIGRCIGAARRDLAARFTGNTITLFLGGSLVLAALLLGLVDPVVGWMATPPEAVSGARDYLTICYLGIPFITAYNIISSIFRGMGNSRTPMYFVAIACVANILLDYLFMGAFHMGPAGAALGTVLSQAISVGISVWMVRKYDLGIPLTRADLKPCGDILRKILRVGVPISMQDGGLVNKFWTQFKIFLDSQSVNFGHQFHSLDKGVKLIRYHSCSDSYCPNPLFQDGTFPGTALALNSQGSKRAVLH
jgi:putative MATE family efflux protein